MQQLLRRCCSPISQDIVGLEEVKGDDRVFFFDAPHGKYVLCVVCRHLNGDGFIVTAYLTDRIKKGVTVYEAHSDHV